MKFLKFDTITQTYNASGKISVVRNCNGITVTNLGDEAVTVDDRILYPGTPGSILGDSYTIGGNGGEIYNKRILNIYFAGGGVNPKVEVTQKYYVE